MTDKELKKLGRSELLELLLEQTEENERLKKELAQTQEKLNDKKILISQSGTMAEATLKLNRVFEAADEACRQYVENFKASSEMIPDTESDENEEQS